MDTPAPPGYRLLSPGEPVTADSLCRCKVGGYDWSPVSAALDGMIAHADHLRHYAAPAAPACLPREIWLLIDPESQKPMCSCDELGDATDPPLMAFTSAAEAAAAADFLHAACDEPRPAPPTPRRVL